MKSEKPQAEKIKASFDLIEDLQEFSEFESKIDPKELLNYYESLPKLHIYQHEIASKENVHHFYKEQELTKAVIEDEDFGEDELLMAEIEEAIQEKDIIQLRDNLKQIAASISAHDFSHEEIDEYLSGEMPMDVSVEFGNELEMNANLAADVKLHKEIEEAIMETDVINLREQLQTIMETQTSYHQEFDEIEQYLDNELAGELLADFENDLFENHGLRADVKLHKEVEFAASENDVMNLRDNLKNIRGTLETKEEKSVIRLNSGLKSILINRYAAAAVLVVVLATSILLRTQPATDGQLYDKFYQETEAVGTSRSSNSFDLTLNNGKELFNAGKYEQAAILFQAVIDKDQTNAIPRFLLGNSYQNLRKSPEAIEQYQLVAANTENTYRDLAEFNIGLCYLLQENKKQAIEQFRKVAKNGNNYGPQAAAILRELK
jgi:TolA-binding protein